MQPSRLTEEEQKQIKDFYQRGQGSIQDYARIYRVSVPEILEIIGEQGLGSAKMSDGDLVDMEELGPTGKGLINGPEHVQTPFSLN